jgi:PAS domain S-box-containing protein
MQQAPFLFTAGTPMAQRMQAMAWASTPLGVPERWDPALHTLVPIMLASNQPMFVAWGPQRTLLYNDPYGQILGDKHPAALGRDILDVWHEIREGLEPLVNATYGGESLHMDDIEWRLARHGGVPEEAHFSFSYSPVRAASGEIGGLFCSCAETTAQVMADRRLAESEARYRRVLENTEEGFTLFDRDFTILEVNEAAMRLTGLSRAELIGHNHWERFPGSHDLLVGQLYRRVLAEGAPDRLEHLYRFPDGRERWFEVRAFPVGGGIAVFFRDFTKRKRLEEELATSFERIQLALDAGAIVGTWVWNIPEDRVVGDSRFAESFGLEPEALKAGTPIEYAFQAIHPDDSERVRHEVALTLETRSAYRCQYRVLRDGAYRWVEACGRVEFDAEGRPLRFPGILVDIEERRRVEAERDRVTALLDTFIEAVPGVVFAKDREGRYLVANRGAAQAMGFPRQAIVGHTDAELLADPAEALALMRRDRDIMASGVAQQCEEVVSRPDGKRAVWWSTKEPLRDVSGEVVGLVGTAVDITDRKRIEDALRHSEQRLALAMEVAQLGTWYWDLDSGAVVPDERCRAMCGLPGGSAPLDPDALRARIHRDDWPRVQQAFERSLASDGSGRYAEEFRWVHADGRVVWTAARGSVQFQPRTGGGSRAVAMLCSMTDITERRQMIEALREADRRKDEFLAMLAHELRNPLAPINTASHVMKLSQGDPARVLGASEIISRQVGHLTRLVDDLLDVSRVTRGLVELERRPLDLTSVVSTAIEQVKPLVQARRHELRTRLGVGPFIVSGDFHRLVQVVSNLLINAAKYTPQGGFIDVGLEQDGAQAAITVADNGVGIAPEMIERVFDLFIQAERTPDRSQGGLGIGLALVKSLVQLHDGQVQARSPGLGHGSTFRVALPLAHGAQADAGLHTAPAHGAGRRVLVVDDNLDAAATLADVLRLSGHAVATAPDGTGALACAAGAPAWDVCILDIGLPDMTGHELARRLRQLPAARDATFIALTGYGQAHDRSLSRESGFDHHLVKPADLDQIVGLLAAARAAT